METKDSGGLELELNIVPVTWQACKKISSISEPNLSDCQEEQKFKKLPRVQGLRVGSPLAENHL